MPKAKRTAGKDKGKQPMPMSKRTSDKSETEEMETTIVEQQTTQKGVVTEEQDEQIASFIESHPAFCGKNKVATVTRPAAGILQLPHRDLKRTRYYVGPHRGHYKTSSEHMPGIYRRPINDDGKICISRPPSARRATPGHLQGSAKATFNCDHDSRCPSDS
ncbi:hypothetical protein Bbelb_038150 [Branchiostoma belcheri]|nr:hypothetical protein Bbelb_038150 [Branchiostoma belcheri]